MLKLFNFCFVISAKKNAGSWVTSSWDHTILCLIMGKQELDSPKLLKTRISSFITIYLYVSECVFEQYEMFVIT